MKKKLFIFGLISLLLLTITGCLKIDISSESPNGKDTTITKDSIDNGDTQNNNDKKTDADEKPTDTDEKPTGTNEKPPSKPSNTTVEKQVRLFYYDAVNDKIVYSNQTVLVYNKAVATAITNELKNPSNKNVYPVIPATVKLLSANVDTASNTIVVNFSSNFVKDQNLGSGTESMTLQAIVNTFGYNFNVDKVIITLEGKPYASGHILMNEGESFKVNYENIFPI